MKKTHRQANSDFIEVPTFDGAVPCELSADYILPDVYPDVKKILRVKATPVMLSRFVSGHRLEFSGAVDYMVLFSADNEAGEELHSVHFAGDFNGTLGDPEGFEAADIDIVPIITACTAKCANPRKLTIKSTVSCSVRVTAPRECFPECTGAESDSEIDALEKLTKTVAAKSSRTFVTDPLKINDSIELDQTYPCADEIICCDAEIFFTDVRPDTSGALAVTLKGNAVVSCLYKASGEGTDYRSVTKKLPLSAAVSADEFEDFIKNCHPDSITAAAFAVPIEVSTSVAEDSRGEKRRIELDISADVTVRLMGLSEAKLISDAYSTVRKSECDYSYVEYLSPVQLITSNFSVGESLDREELDIPEGASVSDVLVTLENVRLETNRSRGILMADARISCIMTDGSGNFAEYSSTVPVKYELPSGEMRTPTAFESAIIPSDVRARLDSRKLYIDFEVNFTAVISEKNRCKAVSKIALSGEKRRKESGFEITLCYRSAGETLWDIAKRYRTTAKAIEAVNKDISGVIMIPRCAI